TSATSAKKSDTMTTSDRRPSRSANSFIAAGTFDGPAGLLRSSASITQANCPLPACAGSQLWSRAPNIPSPTLSVCLSIRYASEATIFAAYSNFVGLVDSFLNCEPSILNPWYPIDPLRSSRITQRRFVSSSYSRTYGRSVRAITRQPHRRRDDCADDGAEAGISRRPLLHRRSRRRRRLARVQLDDPRVDPPQRPRARPRFDQQFRQR